MKTKHKAKKMKSVSDAFKVQPWEEGEDWLEDIRFILYIWLGSICLEGWFGSIAGISYSMSITFLATLFVSCIIYLMETEVTELYAFLPYIVVCLIAVILLIFTPLHEGFMAIIYDVHKTFASRGLLFPFTGICTESVLYRTGAMIMIGCFLLVIIRIVLMAAKIPAFILLITFLIAELSFGNGEGILWFFLWIVWLLLPMITNTRAYIFAVIPAIIVFGILFVVTGGNQGAQWNQRWTQFRYHTNDEILPQGNLSRSGKLNRSSDIALTVEGADGAYYYLKGFVGTILQGNSWKNDSQMLQDFEAGINSNQSDFLQSLHEEGYSGWNQLSDELQTKDQKILKIKNIDAATGYLYVPYEMLTSAAQIEESRMGVFSTGEVLLANGIFGKKTYQIKTKSSLAGTKSVTSPSDVQNNISLYASYAEYVNRTCLNLSKKQKDQLRELLGKTTISSGDDPFPVIERIRSWLKDNLTYSETPGAVPSNMEFVEWLSKHQSGYDIQYATMAVLMFRYYGIPSRYVEGYLVTGKSEISEEFAHAWPEIYLPDYGWLPVEVMSNYQKIMPSYFAEDGGVAITTDIDPEENDTDETTEQFEENTTQDDEKSSEDSETSEESETTEITEENEITADADDSSEGLSQTDRTRAGNSIANLIKTIASFLKKQALAVILAVLSILFILSILSMILRERHRKRRLLESDSVKTRIISWYMYCILMIYTLEKDPVRKNRMKTDNRVETWEMWWKETHPEVNQKLLQEAVMLRQRVIYTEKKVQLREAKQTLLFYKKEYEYFYQQLKLKEKIKILLGRYQWFSC